MTVFTNHRSLQTKRSKVACLAILVFLAACDSKESHDRLSRTIVLECSGQAIDLTNSERKPASFLIKIDPQNQSQKSLHFYNSDEKMFVSPCESKFPDCKVSVNPDLITEAGVMHDKDNKLLLAKTTNINRRTGSIKISAITSTHGEETTFEGICKKGELPDEQPTKF